MDDVLFSVKKGQGGDVGVITLNRPKVLNSINHQMIVDMHQQLKSWSVDMTIKAVVIKAAEGRAFCAGGDLKLTYERARAHHPNMADFFRDEYELNKCIYHYKKPYIAFLDGITMGGGVGISIHGSHRIATERLMFAMPETGIGLFPDVGGTFFLPRLPSSIGFYLGLTGARLNHHDATYVGLTNAFVQSEKLESVLTELANTPFNDNAKKSVSSIISSYQSQSEPGFLSLHEKEIHSVFSKNTMSEIVLALEKSESEFAKTTLTQLQKKSPTSLKVTLLALQKGQHMDFDDCMKQEFCLVSHFLNEHDFIEGIRAVIIDKDQSPSWIPSDLSDVNDSDVSRYFTLHSTA